MKLTERLGKEWVFFDGGMGTILQAHGLKAGELPKRGTCRIRMRSSR